MKQILWKRIMAFTLAVVTLIGAIPLSVFAAADINTGKPTDVNDPVVLALYTGSGFPGEPALYGAGDYLRINNKFEVTQDSVIFASSATDLLKEEIINDVRQGASNSNTDVWGVYSAEGNKAYFKEGSSLILPENELKIIKSAKGQDATLDQYEIIWYVIKLQSSKNTGWWGNVTRSNEWHIDGIIKERTTYAVNYYGNGNTGGQAPLGVTNIPEGGSYTVLGNTGNLSKTVGGNRHEFLGWSQDPLASSPQYVAGNVITNINSNVTLYAVWNSNVKYTATVNTYLDGVLTDPGDIHNEGTKLYLKAMTGTEYVELTRSSKGVYTAQVPNSTYYVWHDEGNGYERVGNYQLLIENASGSLNVHHYSVTYDTNGGAFDSASAPGVTNYFSGSSVSATNAVPKRDGYIFKGWKYGNATVSSGALITSAINEKTTLTAIWQKAVSVKINVTVDHRTDGAHDLASTKDHLAIDLLVRENSTASYVETGHRLNLNGEPISGFDIQRTYKSGYTSGKESVTITKYLATTWTYTGLDGSYEYTVTTAKSGYNLVSVTPTQDADGNWTIDVVLEYDTRNVDFEFSLEMESDTPKELYPAAAIVKIATWSTERNTWYIIPAQEGLNPGIRVDIDPDTGEGSGSYSLWIKDSEGNPYGYRIVVSAFVYADGTIVSTNEKISGYFAT